MEMKTLPGEEFIFPFAFVFVLGLVILALIGVYVFFHNADHF